MFSSLRSLLGTAYCPCNLIAPAIIPSLFGPRRHIPAADHSHASAVASSCQVKHMKLLEESQGGVSVLRSDCRKQVRLMGFQCRCGELFCSEHRYSDRHDCCYNYKAAGREAISRDKNFSI